ncbi:COG4190 Predicted transcriptional regulator [Methylophilaceae bacterium]
MNKRINIGIMSQDEMRDRMVAIARGQYKPKANEPKIWFSSMKSLAEVLSDDNRALLKIIREVQPESISDLAELTGRKQSNLSRTLKTMSGYGLVEMIKDKRQVRPVVSATEYQILAA